jgi:two-component system CheB/CheR fusion protein
MTDKREVPEKRKESTTGFPIVGVGASAGGLAAFEAFFSGMPADIEPGMAFVLIQHLAPDHKSLLSELVRRYTRMQVIEVEDGMPVEINCTYIIPPNCEMFYIKGTLKLLPLTSPKGQRLPIDFFLRSLAGELHEKAIGIILSGTGSDGTLGVRAIKGEGGMVITQRPESTDFTGMPESAIATGLVDYILLPAEMPAQIIAYLNHSGINPLVKDPSQKMNESENLKIIFEILRQQTGHDFSKYKPKTILRRVEHRMAVHRIDQMARYIGFLQKEHDEVAALFRNLLIGVTSFFRDPGAFDELRIQLGQHLFTKIHPGDSIRIWVPGCSTGEEAYSIAILLKEYMAIANIDFMVQIFATDIDSRAIEQARTGAYLPNISLDISEDLLSRYFIPDSEGKYFKIKKSIRDMVVFSEHNLIKDPPFSKVDLISCRNLLIYFGAELQKRIIPLFHYSLNPGGLLFLGNSESIGEQTDLFYNVNKKWKVYQRIPLAHETGKTASGRFFDKLTMEKLAYHKGREFIENTSPPLGEFVEKELLKHFNATALLINEFGEIIYIHGRSGNYLEPAQGMAGVNVFKMAREGLKRSLSAAFQKAAITKTAVHHNGLKVKTNGDYSIIDLTIAPVFLPSEPSPSMRLFLVIFSDTKHADKVVASKEQEGVPTTANVDNDTRVLELEQELLQKEEYLQSTIEEMETTNEELKSVNEEFHSVNEEMQSSNEELETSKEELQSVNEELAIVNAELQSKIADLSRANNDLNNLLAGSGIGTIFVDHQLRIMRFTPTATRAINLIKTDIGRPISHLNSNFINYTNLPEDIKTVLDTLIPKEVEAQIKSGTWYLLRLLPYRTIENLIEGAVVTFVDITAYKKIQETLKETQGLRRLATVIHDSSDAIIVTDFAGIISAWNPGAVHLFGWSEEEALSMNLNDLIPENKHRKEKMILQQLSNSNILDPYITERKNKSGDLIQVSLTATALIDDAGLPYAISITHRGGV